MAGTLTSGYIQNEILYVYGYGFADGDTGELLLNGTALTPPNNAALPALTSAETSYSGSAYGDTLSVLSDNGKSPLYAQMYDATSNTYSNQILIPYGSITSAAKTTENTAAATATTITSTSGTATPTSPSPSVAAAHPEVTSASSAYMGLATYPSQTTAQTATAQTAISGILAQIETEIAKAINQLLSYI